MDDKNANIYEIMLFTCNRRQMMVRLWYHAQLQQCDMFDIRHGQEKITGIDHLSPHVDVSWVLRF